MQVRATHIIKEAEQSGNFPLNPFPFAGLSGAIRKLEIFELNDVFSVQHMIRCIESMIIEWKVPQTGHVFYYDTSLVDERGLEDEDAHWQENLYRAWYRVILAGAIKAYNEPLIFGCRRAKCGFRLKFWRWALG
jgi:hypothetical protein